MIDDLMQLKKHNINILYAEDDENIRESVAKVLNIVSDNIFVACDGAEGIDLFLNNHIDLIITDVNMPKLNGFKMLKRIRENNKDIPAIILSAYSQSDFITEASQIDSINSYLLKPVDVMVLLEKIKINIEQIESKREYKNTIQLLDQYKVAVDNSAIVSKTNIDGYITYVNQQFCDISGYEKHEILGKTHNFLRHPSMQDSVYIEIWETILKKNIWKGKITNLKKDGGYYVVDSTIVPILNSDGKITEFISLRKDITELEAYKDLLLNELHTSKDNLEDNIHTIKEYEKSIDLSSIVIRVTKNLRLTYVNNKFIQISQYSFTDLENAYFYDMFMKDNDNSSDIIKSIKQDGHWQGILKASSKDNTLFYMDITFRAIIDKDGNLIEYMGIGHDITETITIHKDIEDTQKDVIFTLGTIGETRSKETGNHVKRVAEYSYILAKLYGLNKHDCQVIKIASPMHDIGKVGIPDSILNKPAKFTNEEFEIMKNHATIGYSMLKGSNKELLKASAIVAHEHHERWDGKGYPRGLKEDEIHIFGRITAVADVFDALGSDRCYKKAWELDKILQLFKDGYNTQFDGKIVDLLLDNLDMFLEIRDRYKDEF